MRILLVENAIADVDAVGEELTFAGINAELAVARSRDRAIEALDGGPFDVVVCDLRIPSVDDGLDEDEAFGLEILQRARVRHEAVPILILSGFSSLDNVGTLINRPEVNLWGSGPYAMVQDTPKKDYSKCIQQLAWIQSELMALDAVEVVPVASDLSSADLRALKAFARSRNASTIELAASAGGLSSARAVVMRLSDSNSNNHGAAFAKIDSINDVRTEKSRYDTYVSGVLHAGSFPSIIAEFHGGSGRAALIYSLIRGVPRTLFGLLATDPQAARTAVAFVKQLEADCWPGQGAPVERSVQELRAGRRIDDSYLARHLNELPWREFEALHVDVTLGRQHGDLHGSNIAVDPQGQVFLVDFASCEVGPLGLDPTILELSFFAHPAGRDIAAGWPTAENLRRWAHLDDYLKGCPFPEVVRDIRGWATEAARSEEALRAIVYSHGVRQLRLSADRELVRALVEGLLV